MTTPTLNIIDINELLFQNENKINNKPNHTKSNEFNFAQVWGEIDGEYNEVSEFVEACKLIVSNNAIAAAIALNEQSHATSSSKTEQGSLTSFIGDITPAVTAVAVAAGGLEESSPLMNTPYLDSSCMSTPFTPHSVFTPNLAQFHNSPYYSPYIGNATTTMNIQQDDIQVASYLKNDFSSSWHTPATVPTDLLTTPATATVSPELFDTFNGEPSQLLNAATAPPTVDESSNAFDSLFPPLPSDQQQPTYQLNINMVVNHQQQQDTFNAEDFEAGNFLNDCFDDCFFNIEVDDNNNNAPSTSVVAPFAPTTPAVLQQQQATNKKRKNKEPIKKNKRVKTCTNAADAKFECDICHATFNRRYNLGTHIKTHDKNRSKDFACHLCLKPFDRKHDLTRHVATVHNGERAYSCNNCTSTFSRKDALVRHQLQKHQIQQNQQA